MINEKKYYSISEVSQMLQIKEYVIRHWDSIDPKTNKVRIDNLSLRTRGGTRYFNQSHIKKLLILKNLLIENGKRNHSLDLASKIIELNKINLKKTNFSKMTYTESNKNFATISDKRLIRIKKVINNLKKLI